MGASEGVLTLEDAGIAPQKGGPPLPDFDLGFEPRADDCLLVIDVQVDFMPGGALAVGGATEVIPLVNALTEKFECVVLSQDWHPAGHSSFASQHEGKAPLETVAMPYGEQTLWPDHCVQGTEGKGYRASVDSYSAFYENDHETGTGLMEFLKARGVRRVFVVGVAYDFCVRYTCEDAAKCGLRCVLVKDATRAVGLPGTEDAAKKCLAEAGVAEVDAGGLGEAAKATAP